MKRLLILLLAVYLHRNEGVFGQGNGYFRLASSNTSGQGRLEMGYDSTWTPFSIVGFDMQEADIACKRLGYDYASRYATVETLGYDEASTNYSISALRCTGSEFIFTMCKFSTTYSRGSHSSDVGLQCANRANTTTRLRLVPRNGNVSSSVLSGHLEILINDTWGTVCDDNFDSAEAAVACNQLGFISYNSFGNAKNLNWETNLENTPIWLDNLHCYFGSHYVSSDLRFCSNAVGVHDCIHDEDIILTCNSGAATEFSVPIFQPSIGALRLVFNNQTFQYSIPKGRLELYFNHSSSGPAWTSVCYNSLFGSHEADVVCRRLGYARAIEFGTVGDLMQVESSGMNTLYLSCYHVNYFSGCSYYVGSCSHSSEVAISCTTMSLPGLSVGAKVGIAVTTLILCTAIAVGVMIFIVVAGVIHHKKKKSRTCASQYFPQDTSDFKSIHIMGIKESEENPKDNALNSSTPCHPEVAPNHTQSESNNIA